MNRNHETLKSNTPATAANTSGAAKTLRELGVDGGLAAEFELAFRMLGNTEDGKVIGFTFRSPDGSRHQLRLGDQGPAATSRAA